MHNGVKITSHVENHYPTMTFDELVSMREEVLAAANPEHCLLYMWATGPQLAQAIALGEEWGFDYKTTAFVWHKRTKGEYDKELFPLLDYIETYDSFKDTIKGREFKDLVLDSLGAMGKEQVNPGNYTMSSTEPVLVFKRGRIPGGSKKDTVLRGKRNARQFFEDPRTTHSSKPTYPQEMVDLMFPAEEHRKLELFARRPFRDWDVWGNQV